MNKALVYEDVTGAKDKAKRQMQQLYTDAHLSDEGAHETQKTRFTMKT